jgi:hypothetical protein
MVSYSGGRLAIGYGAPRVLLEERQDRPAGRVDLWDVGHETQRNRSFSARREISATDSGGWLGGQRMRWDFLDYVFRMVAHLRGPVALPGFFTGADDTAVIDVRRENRATFKSPLRLWDGAVPKSERPRIALRAEEALVRGYPRIWLTPRTAEHRADVDRALAAPSTAPEELARALQSYRRVNSITADAVGTTH